MKINDAITGALFLALAVAVYFYAGTFSGMSGLKYGPDLFPRVVAAAMGLGGLIVVVGALRPAGRQPLIVVAEWARRPRTYLTIAAVLGSLLFYILFSELLGFLLTASLILGGLLLVTRGPSKLVSSFVISVAVAAIIYTIFAQFLRVPLPVGVIESLVR